MIVCDVVGVVRVQSLDCGEAGTVDCCNGIGVCVVGVIRIIPLKMENVPLATSVGEGQTGGHHAAGGGEGGWP